MNKNNSKIIYPVHEYGDETHFKALYDCASEYGYEVGNQIILRKSRILRKYIKAIVQRRQIIEGTKQFFVDCVNHIKLHFLKDNIMIVGIAPYDFLLNKYSTLFKKNRSFYFTSQIYWDGSNFPKGTRENKSVFEQLLTECFEGAFCVSKKTEEQVKKFITKTSVVNHAIDVDLYKKSLDIHKNPRRYIFAGGFSERKNVELILEWLAENREANVKIDFAGGGPLKQKINEFSSGDQRVTDFGFCSKKHLQEILCTYDFMILPSKEEPFGISLLEALAAGVPCVVSDAVGPKEIIEDGVTGFIFYLTDQSSTFSNAMKRSLEISDVELIEMRKNAMIDGRRYDSKEIVKRWLLLL